MFTRGLELDFSLFIPPVQPGLRGQPLKVLQGPCRRFRKTLSFSIRGMKFWNFPLLLVPAIPSNHSSTNWIQHGWIWLQKSCDSPPAPITISPFALSQLTPFPPLMHCHTQAIHTYTLDKERSGGAIYRGKRLLVWNRVSVGLTLHVISFVLSSFFQLRGKANHVKW